MKAFILLLVLFSFSALIAQTHYADYWEHRVYFKIKDGASQILPEFNISNSNQVNYEEFPYINEWIQQFNITEITRPFRTPSEKVKRIYRVTFDSPGNIDRLVAEISRLPYVEYAEKCPMYKISSVPNDTAINEQYYLTNIRAFDAWEMATGSKQVRVAIVDDACRITHPDLIGNIYRNLGEVLGDSIDNDGNGYIDDFVGWDAADNDNNPNAPLNPPAIWGEMAFTHGTHCAGLAGAVTNNTTGIASISHNVSIIPVKTVRNGSFLPLAIETPAEGVDYAITAGAHIVSMSFGGAAAGFATLEILINYGDSIGVTFVAAAGNDGNQNINYPAGFEKVISVGATTVTDEKASFSQYGDWIDVMAPGAAMYSTLAWSSPYGPMDGTSMACPLTAGALALMKSYRFASTPAELKSCLLQGCDNIDSVNAQYIGLMGAGRINVFHSLLCLSQLENVNEVITPAFTVYPIPAENILYYKSLNTEPVQLTITGICGKTVWHSEKDNPQGSIDISHLPAGFYILHIQNGKLELQKKFLVIR